LTSRPPSSPPSKARLWNAHCNIDTRRVANCNPIHDQNIRRQGNPADFYNRQIDALAAPMAPRPSRLFKNSPDFRLRAQQAGDLFKNLQGFGISKDLLRVGLVDVRRSRAVGNNPCLSPILVGY
jgi:hypothetical protein